MPIIPKFKSLNYLNKKRSLSRLLFLFSIAIAHTTKTEAIGNYLDLNSVLTQIEFQKIYEEPKWLALLQIKHNSPQIKDKNFYTKHHLSSAKEEMFSFVNELFSTNKEKLICTYPARFYWLKSKLNLPEFDFSNCKELNDFIDKAPLEKASIVFASENLTQPSSMMGHIFIKIQGSNSSQIYVEHAISFFTEINDFNIPKLIFESLITGKRGFYTLSPYEQNKNYYLLEEQRNIWEYQLKLNNFDRILLHYYLFELKNINFSYYFHSFNCATLIQNILNVIHSKDTAPEPNLWVSPLDIVRFVHKNEMINSSKLIPSSKWKIKALTDAIKLNKLNREIIKQRNFETIDINKSNITEAVKIYELAIAYNDYQYETRQIDHESWTKSLSLLTKQKNSLGNNLTIDISNYKNPASTIKDTQLFFKQKYYINENSSVLGFLPASHSILDNNSQYQNETELKTGEISFKYSSTSHSLSLNSLVLYSVMSLQPNDFLTGGLSGILRLGFEPQLNNYLSEEGTVFIEGGPGKTYRLQRDTDFYFLFKLGYQDRLEPYFYLAPTIGILLREIYDMKTLFEYMDYNYIDTLRISRASFTQVLNHNNLSLSLNIFQNSLKKELKTQPSSINKLTEVGFEFTAKYIF